MSDVSKAAVVNILMADYAVSDPSGKLNIIGGGISLLGMGPSGATAPFMLVVAVSVPPTFYREECSVEILLEDSAGDMVSVPGPSTEPQAMRIGQVLRFDEPPLPQNVQVPRNILRSRKQFVLNFAGGLPLTIGESYKWRVKVDGDSRDEWAEIFVVPRPQSGPVLG